jgi:hypothetical protein
MSDGLLKRLGVVLLVIVVAWAALALFRRTTQDRFVSLAIPRVDTAAVERVTLSRAHDTATLTRAAAGRWRVNGFPADSGATATLVRALADTAERTELVAESRGSHPRLGVDADSGTHIRVAVRGGAVPLELIGGKRTDAMGIYVRRPADSAVYALHGMLVTPLTRAVDDWRDKRVATVIPDSVATVELQRAGRMVRLERKDTVWMLAGKPANGPAVVELLGQFHPLTAGSIASQVQADSVRFGKTARHVTLRSRAGVALLALSVDSTAGAWLRADTGGVVYRIDPWMLTRLTPAESTFKHHFAPSRPSTRARPARAR